MGALASQQIKDIFVKKPFLGFKVNSFIFTETTYGIVKRLSFFVREIESVRKSSETGPSDLKIIDVGCGTGVNVTIPLAEIGYSVAGVDTDKNSIEQARSMAEGISNIKFYNSSLEGLCLDDKFRVAICSEVLEHLKEPAPFLEKINKIIERGGLLLITIPNERGYFKLDKSLENLFPNIYVILDRIRYRWVKNFGSKKVKLRYEYEKKICYWRISQSSLAPDKRHYISFTPWYLKNLLEKNGFMITNFCNNTLLAGNILQHLVKYWGGFLNINCKIADFLPYWACSDWMIAARKI